MIELSLYILSLKSRWVSCFYDDTFESHWKQLESIEPLSIINSAIQSELNTKHKLIKKLVFSFVSRYYIYLYKTNW